MASALPILTVKTNGSCRLMFRLIDYTCKNCFGRVPSRLLNTGYGRKGGNYLAKAFLPRVPLYELRSSNRAFDYGCMVASRSANLCSGKNEGKIERHENIYTIPNFLTVGRFLAAPLIGTMILQERYEAGLVLFMLAGFTDLLDGYIARNWKGQSSVLGSVIDPLADKVLVVTLSLSLTYAGFIPVWLTTLILARDTYLIVNGFRVRFVTLPPPKTFRRYFDFSLPSASVQPTFISKINTNLQILLLAASIGAPVFDYVNHPFLHVMWMATAATTSWTFFDYVRANTRGSAYTVLKKS